MKTILSIIALVLVSLSTYAQDTLKLKNGTKVLGVVTEISSTQVKFKKTASGPVYVMQKDEIVSISYENGTTEVLTETEVKVPANNTTATTPTAPKKIGKYNANDDAPNDNIKHYSGPRIGVTFFSDGSVADDIGTNAVSQFGWQFETRFFTADNGSSGLFEFIPLVGGMERGVFLPSATALIGFRSGKGYEFGCGPTLALSGFGMVFAAGTSFQMGSVCFPVNIAFQPNIAKEEYRSYYDPSTGQYIEQTRKVNTGFRISLLVGFNARNK
ncbi:hypothetical protein BH09BAC5_BH09BAC5_17940 [soil metagenome]